MVAVIGVFEQGETYMEPFGSQGRSNISRNLQLVPG